MYSKDGYLQFSMHSTRNGSLPSSWPRSPEPYSTNGCRSTVSSEIKGGCSPNFSIGLMLDWFISHHAGFFVDLGRVMARNMSAILTLKPSPLQSDQPATPEPGGGPGIQWLNPERSSPRPPDKRICGSLTLRAGFCGCADGWPPPMFRHRRGL